jgi:hypothetical protein
MCTCNRPVVEGAEASTTRKRSRAVLEGAEASSEVHIDMIKGNEHLLYMKSKLQGMSYGALYVLASFNS